MFWNQQHNAERDYFVGHEGVRMLFFDPAAPPPRMYYFSDMRPDDNRFLISVDVHNVGSSWTRGGVYISGYDPSMIRIREIDIPRLNGGWGDCIIDFGVFGGANTGNFWDTFFGQVGCSEVGFNAYSQGSQNWGLRVNQLGQIFPGLADSWLGDIGFRYETVSGMPSVGMDFGSAFNFDYLNRGQGLMILLSGLSFQRFNGQEYILAPNDYNFPGGERETIIFNGEIRGWPRGLDRTERPITFLATNCYIYATYAAPQVCIDPQPFNDVPKVCQPRPINFNRGTGAPVAITSVFQENTPRTVYFTINIQNVGIGQVFDMGYIERCSPYFPGRVGTNHLDVVYLIDARIGDQQLFCTPARGNGIRLANGRGTVICRYNIEFLTASSAFETPLILEVGYGYGETLRRHMTVKRAI